MHGDSEEAYKMTDLKNKAAPHNPERARHPASEGKCEVTASGRTDEGNIRKTAAMNSFRERRQGPIQQLAFYKMKYSKEEQTF
ncbi:hypothetical protein ILUMI_14040 [Ignelater luminosus]|uniref:Uncharacterized protein n=1 Tax=Ignelater luminosus TaxID=2038154 RepID=A0A8K0CR58_IGNLU|nr:hypothetical protein ILUMI_14040 [Ignelater luminosus]